MFAAIERAIGDGISASVSYVAFSLDHHIARKAVSPSLKLLDHLGLIDIEPGPRLVNVFRFSNRARTIDEVEAVRLAELARETMTHRRFERRREPDKGKATETVGFRQAKPKPVQRLPMTTARPHVRRQVPSMPRMPMRHGSRRDVREDRAHIPTPLKASKNF